MASAIANRYAAALSDVLAKPSAAQTQASALEQLRAFEGVLAESVELRNLFASPAVAASQKRKLTEVLGQRLGVAAGVRNLLFILIDNRRMGEFTDIVEAYEAALDARRGVARIRVASALPVNQRDATANGTRVKPYTEKCSREFASTLRRRRSGGTSSESKR